MTKRITAPEIIARKGQIPLVVLTCYTAPMAKLLDQYVDILLVGDSLGMVIYGMASTLPVTTDMMVAHSRAVSHASQKALVVADLPFGSYQASKEDACRAATRLLSESGAQAVKLEGGREMAETIQFLVERGIPVMGHVGLKPQSVHAMGGFRTQGKTDSEAANILQDAMTVEQAGAFAIVIEGVKESVARHVTSKVKIPTIGIGASTECDGQVLVIDDMLGLSSYIPGFVKQYAQLLPDIENAVKTYAKEVQTRKFPTAEYTFPYKKK